MASSESVGRLLEARLLLRVGPTRTGMAALVADNVEFSERGTIRKREGYRRWMDIQEAHPITGLLSMENRYLVMAGDLDEQ